MTEKTLKMSSHKINWPRRLQLIIGFFYKSLKKFKNLDNI